MTTKENNVLKKYHADLAQSISTKSNPFLNSEKIANFVPPLEEAIKRSGLKRWYDRFISSCFSGGDCGEYGDE